MGQRGLETQITCTVPKEILTKCGFQFNDKTSWQPSKRKKFLGFEINSKLMKFKIPTEKREVIQVAIKTFLKKKAGTHNISELASIVGILNSLAFVEKQISLWLRQTFKYLAEKQRISLAIRKKRSQQFLLHSIPIIVVQELSLCLHMVNNSKGRTIIFPQIQTEIWIDTGEWATGYHGDSIGHGVIPLETDDLFRSSTRREMKGLLSVLSIHATAFSNMHVKVNLDNHAVVRNNIKNGGPVDELVKILKSIRKIQSQRNIILTTTWIPREQNKMADALSKSIKVAWELQPDAINKIYHKFAGIEIIKPDFNNIAKQFHAIKRRSTSCIIIHPVWKTASWWTLVQETQLEFLEFPTAAHALQTRNNEHVKRARWRIRATLCASPQLHKVPIRKGSKLLSNETNRKRKHRSSMDTTQPFNKAGDGPTDSDIIIALEKLGAKIPEKCMTPAEIIAKCKHLSAQSSSSAMHTKTILQKEAKNGTKRKQIFTIPESGYTNESETDIELQKRMIEWINNNRPKNTMRSYNNAEKQFVDFCNATGRVALPATPATLVTAFMKACTERGLRAGTINGNMLAGISNMHSDAGLPTPTKAQLVKRAKKVVGRITAPPKRTIPLQMQQIFDAAAAVDVTKFIHVRDFVILLFAVCASLRPSELVALKQNQIQQTEVSTKGGKRDVLSINIQERKNDQEREGHTILLPRLPQSQACPYTWTARLRDFTPGYQISAPFFCKNHKSSMAPLSSNTIKNCIRNTLKRSGLTEKEVQKFVSNSARAGGFSAAIANGTHPIIMKHHGGWKSDAAFTYLKETNATRLKVTEDMLDKLQPQFHYHTTRASTERGKTKEELAYPTVR